MNLNYNSQLPQRVAIPSRDMAAQRMAPLPGPFGAAYDDNARALSVEGLSNYNRAADQANFAYAADARKGQQGLALQGLQNMAQDQQQQQQFDNSRLQTMLGVLRGLA